MGSKNEEERKLLSEISCLVEEMGKLCNGALTDELRVERCIKDAEFSEELFEHIKRVVECRKLSEMYADTGLGMIRYVMYLSINPNSLQVSGPAKLHAKK